MQGKRVFSIASKAIVVWFMLCPHDGLAGVIDDFDDNVRNPLLWDTDMVWGIPGISLNEQNGRLELLSSSVDLDQSYVMRQCWFPLPYEQDWTATIDVANLKDINTQPSVRIGMGVVGSGSPGGLAGILLKADDGGRRLQDIGFGDLWSNQPDTLQDNGVLQISYGASDHILSLGFVNGMGGSPLILETVDVVTGSISSPWPSSLEYPWGMQPGDHFYPVIYATTAGTPASSGEVYLDNLRVDVGGTVPAPGAILLGTIGAGLVGWLRRRRTW